MDNMLDMHGEMLMGQYHAMLPRLEKLEQQVSAMLEDALQKLNIEINTLGHRIKSEASFIGKLDARVRNTATLVTLRTCLVYAL